MNIFSGTTRWYLLSVLVIVADLITKWAASNYLVYGVAEPVIAGFNLTLLHNNGAAFSFLATAGGWQRWLFGLIGVVVSTVLVIWIKKLPATARWLPCALALVLGGALGNLYDRIMLGYVVDFIDIYYSHYHWPAFNVADSAITVGAIMLIVDGMRSQEKT